MSDQEKSPILESYKDKLNYLQRVIIIFLGVAFFFFFMTLLPYYSIKADNYMLSKIDNLVNQTSYNIGYINQSLNEQISKANSTYMPQKKLSEQYNNNANEDVNRYYKQLINDTSSDEALRRITQPTCKDKILRSDAWINCNVLQKTQQLQKVVNTEIPTTTFKLNNTLITKIENTISLQDELTADSKNLLNTDYFLLIKNALENLLPQNQTGMNVQKLDPVDYKQRISFIQRTFGNVKEYIGTIHNQTDNKANSIQNRFTQLETPITGKIPIDFNDMVAVFPVAIAVVFFFCTQILRDTIRLFNEIYNNKGRLKLTDKYVSSIAPLWIRENRWKEQIPAFMVLVTPVILFITSLSMIVSIWLSVVKGDRFPPFVAAYDFNMYLYIALYSLSALLYLYCYYKILPEIRSLYNGENSVKTK
jgi:hypothetical protein